MARSLSRFALLFGVIALALAGCGESRAEKAKAEVCKSRTEIHKQVEALEALTLSPSSISTAQSSFQKIEAELEKIKKEAPKLEGTTKTEAEEATSTFKSQISSIASSLTSNFNVATAETQFKAALEQLVKSYKQTLEKISC